MNMAMMHCRMKNDAPEDGGVRGTDEKRSLTKQSHPAKRNGKKDGREFSRLFSVWQSFSLTREVNSAIFTLIKKSGAQQCLSSI